MWELSEPLSPKHAAFRHWFIYFKIISRSLRVIKNAEKLGPNLGSVFGESQRCVLIIDAFLERERRRERRGGGAVRRRWKVLWNKYGEEGLEAESHGGDGEETERRARGAEKKAKQLVDWEGDEKRGGGGGHGEPGVKGECRAEQDAECGRQGREHPL